MEKVRIHIENPHKRAIESIVKELRDDGIVLLPGDTSYLLAIRIGSKSALEKLNRLKQNKKKKFYSVMFKDFAELAKYADISDQQYQLIKRALPGPFTFILKASKNIPKIMLENRKELGIRIPDSPFIYKLLEELGEPIIVSTAAVEGNDDFFQDPEIDEPEWLHMVDMVVDGDYLLAELTTVIHVDGSEYDIIRIGKGDITKL